MKLYHQGEDLVVGACDEDLLGKTFTKGDLQIEVSRLFYDGERVTSDRLKNILEEATIANLVGKTCVDLAIQLGYVDPDHLLVIDDVPHAQIVHML